MERAADVRSDGEKVLSEILRIFLVNHKRTYAPDSATRQFCKQIPRLTKAEIAQVEESFAKTKSLELAFKQIYQYFPNKQGLFERFVKQGQQITMPDCVVAVPLMAFINWMGQTEIIDSYSRLEEVMSIIRLLWPAHATLGEFCLTHAVSHYLSHAQKPFPSYLIGTTFVQCSPRLFDVTVSVLNNALLNRDETGSRYLIDLLTKSIAEAPSRYERCDFQDLRDTLFPLLREFDRYALGLVSILASVKIDPGLKETISDMARILLYMVERKDPVIAKWPSVTESMVATIDAGTDGLVLSDIEDCGERDGIERPTIADFSTSLELSAVLSPETVRYANGLVSFVSRVLEDYAVSFFEGFAEIIPTIEGKSCEVEYNLCMLYIMSKARYVPMTTNVMNVLVSRNFFTPGISVFNRCENFELVTLIRKTVLGIFASHSPAIVLQNFKAHPFLFVDIIGRIHMDLDKFDLSSLSDDTIAAIIHVVSNLSSLSRQGDELVMKKAHEARSVLFMFLLAILEDDKIATKCFSSAVFTNVFLSKLFEASLQDAILSLIRKFLSRFNGNDTSILRPLVDFVSRIIYVCRSMSDDENPGNVFSSLIESVNGAVIHNRDVGSVFEPVLDAATAFLMAHPTESFLDQTLQLYSVLLFSSSEISLSVEHIQQLSQVIRNSQAEAPSETTMSGIIAMMARSRSVNTSAMFLIHEPLAVILILSIIHSPSDSSRYLSLFSQLCANSPYNCVQCHKGELDMLLLKLMHTQSFSFRGCKFDMSVTDNDIRKMVIPLIMTIITYACSQQVIANIVELACPSQEGVFPPFSLDLMTKLQATATMITQNPPPLLYLGYSDQTIIIENIHSSSLEKGFTFQCSLFLDCHTTISTGKKPMIISIIDSEMSIHLYFQSDSLICTVMSPGSRSFACLTNAFPSGEWVNVTIVFDIPPDCDASVSLYINNNLPIVYTVGLPVFRDSSLKVVLGGLFEEGEERDELVQPICILGSYTMLSGPTERRKVMELNGLGMRSSQLAAQLFSSVHQKKSDLFCTVMDVLAKKNVIANFIPFFLYFPVMPNHYPDMLMGLFRSVFSTASLSRCPDDFPFFPLISHMLILCPPEKLNYGTYLMFFGFLDVTTNEKLIYSLVKHILFNFEIWYPVDGTNLVRIVAHWAQSLFPSCQGTTGSVFQFSDILSLIRVYFWYEPKEIEIIRGRANSSRPRASNFDIESCRAQLNRLLLSMSRNPQFFSISSVRSLISHSLVCPDSQQVNDFLWLFVEILKSRGMPFAIPPLCSNMLYFHFKPSQETRVILALQAIYLTHQENFHEKLISFMTTINQMFFTAELFSKCLDTLPEFPLFYPLAVLLAINVGDDKPGALAKGLSRLVVDRPLAITILRDPLWALWPILLLQHLDERHHIFVYGFMLSVLAHRKLLVNLDQVMNIFKLVAGNTGWYMEKIALTFFVKVAEHYFGECDPITQAGIVMRGVGELLVYINYPGESAIERAFLESPFRDNLAPEKVRHKKLFSIDDIRTISSESREGSRFKFGFILDKNLRPVKQELFSALMNMIKQVQIVDDMLAPWEAQLSRFAAERRDPEEARKLNIIADVYFAWILRRNLLGVAQVKKTIADSFSDSEDHHLHEIGTEEIAISTSELYSTQESISQQNCANQDNLRRMFRDVMHSCSPWKRPAPAQTLRREFIYGQGHSQPLVKCASDTGCEIRGSTGNQAGAIECKLIQFGQEIPAHVCWPGYSKLIIRTNKVKRIRFKDIKRIYLRSRFHKETGLEIFTDNRSYFLDFKPKRASSVLSSILDDIGDLNRQCVQTSPPQQFFESMNYMEKWVSGRISNFKYLMMLNEFAGRTFNDMCLYPIFPWIISDYASTSFATLKFRDLGLPITCQPLGADEEPRCSCTFRLAPSHPTLLSYFLGTMSPFNAPADVILANQVLSKKPFMNMSDAYHNATTNPNAWELPPELFFAPEHLPNGFEFPQWANGSAFEFVYLHRKALESDVVSANLNKWIDLIFGVKSRGPAAKSVGNVYDPDLYRLSQKDDDIVVESMLRKVGQLPTCLFSLPHPPRKPLSQTPVLPSPKTIDVIDKEIVCAQVLESTSSEIVFVAICKDLSVVSCCSEFVSPLRKSTMQLQSLPKGNIITCGHSTGIIAFDNDKHVVYNISDGKVLFKPTDLSDIVFIESSRDRIAMSTKDGNIWCWTFPVLFSRPVVLNNTTDYASCIAISQRFGIAAVGTYGAHVIVYSLKGGSFRYVLDVPEPPKRILITEGWGFIVVESGENLFLFNVNGAFIRKTELQFSIGLMTTWKCEKGFDFVAIAEPQGSIRVFEAFYLNPEKVTHANKHPIVSMFYSVATRLLAAVRKDGKLIVIPIEL